MMGGDEEREAEFVFAGNKVVRMGVELEEDLEELIWFERSD